MIFIDVYHKEYVRAGWPFVTLSLSDVGAGWVRCLLLFVLDIVTVYPAWYNGEEVGASITKVMDRLPVGVCLATEGPIIRVRNSWPEDGRTYYTNELTTESESHLPPISRL